MLRISNITKEGGVDETDLVFLTEEKAASLASTQVVPGDLVISQRGTLGMPAVVPADYPAWNVSANLVAISRIAEISPAFVQLYLSSSVGGSQIARCQSGQVQGKITTEDVASVLIPKVEDEAALVADMDAAREARRDTLARADGLLSGLDGYLLEQLGLVAATEDGRQTFAVRLREMSGKRIDAPAYRPFFAKGNPPATPTKPLREIAAIDANKNAPPLDEADLVPYVGLPECTLTEVREVAQRPYSEVKGRSVLRPGDILFARIEPSVFNKKYVLVDDLKGYDYAYTSTEFYTVRAKPSETIQGYLYAMFFCSFVFAQVKGKTTGSSGRRRIDPELFANLQIPVPDKAVQQAIADEVSRRRAEARRLRQQAEQDWAAAKARFERRLLGEGLGHESRRAGRFPQIPPQPGG